MANKSNKSKLFQSVKGMEDVLPKDQPWWSAVQQAGRQVSELHDFYFIETPLLEPAGLFEAGVGALTDIVEKEMYVFRTKGGDQVALRPEGTAPVMRSYLQHQLGYFASPLKVYYLGPFFRYERPQAGRERQFHQWGLEVIGDGDPVYDAEIILAGLDFFSGLKLKDIQLKINTIGCRVCRPTYRQKLKDYYRPHKSKLCKDCQRRYDKNPFRLLDCKEEGCRRIREKAPIILDYLCQNCNGHFRSVLEIIEDNMVAYEPDPYLVRGLDYYNRTVFEFHRPASAAELGGGGRYDYLAELLGGRMIPAAGAAIGLERVIEVLKSQHQSSGNLNNYLKGKPKIFFAAVGVQAKKSSLRLIEQLRRTGIIVAEALGKGSLRAQLKSADRSKVGLALIFGQKEVFEGTIIVRDMVSGAQETILLDNMVEEVKRRLK